MNGILDGKFIENNTVTEEKLSEDLINKLEQPSIENLIAKKWILDWRDYLTESQRVSGCYLGNDQDGEYIYLNGATIYNTIVEQDKRRDVFFGKIKFKENTQYQLKCKLKRISGTGRGIIWSAMYTDGTYEAIIEMTMGASPQDEVVELSGMTEPGKTVSHFYVTYGTTHAAALYDIMLTEGNQVLQGYIPHKEDLPEFIHKEDSLLGKATGVCTADGGYYRELSENESALLASAKTIELLITTPTELPNYTTNTNHWIVRITTNVSQNYTLSVSFCVNKNGTCDLYFYTNGSTYYLSAPVELGKAYHLIGTLDDTNKNLLLYLDGEFVGQTPYIPTEAIPRFFAIGNSGISGTLSNARQFPGIVHYTRVFNYTFRPEDVTTYYNKGNYTFYTLSETEKNSEENKCMGEYLPSGFTKTHAIDTSGSGLDLVATRVYHNPVLSYKKLDIPYSLKSVRIPAESDLNDYTTVGFFRCINNADAESVFHSPTTFAFSLLVETTTSSGCTQTLTEYRTTNTRKWFRNLHHGTWNDWQQFSITKDLENYLPLTGGRMSGSITMPAGNPVYFDNESNYIRSSNGSNSTLALQSGTGGIVMYTDGTGNIALNPGGKVTYNGNEIATLRQLGEAILPFLTSELGTSETLGMTQSGVTNAIYDTTATTYRVRIGSGATTSNNYSTAVGNSATAGNYSTAFGYNARATGAQSVAIGYGTSMAAVATQCVMVGYSAGSNTPNITSVGYNTSCTGSGATALGSSANAAIKGSVALGQNSTVTLVDVPDITEEPYGVVSVGRTAATDIKRRIINVRNGVNDNDAATVGQMKEAISIETNKHLPLSGGTLTNTLTAPRIDFVSSSSNINIDNNTFAIGTGLEGGVRINANNTSANIALNTKGGKVTYNSNEIATVNDIPSIVDETGSKSDAVMSQKAVTTALSSKADTSSLSSKLNITSVFNDTNQTAIQIGSLSSASPTYSIAIGYNASTQVQTGVTIGQSSKLFTTDVDASDHTDYMPVSFGESGLTNTKRRLINVRNGVKDSDAATVGQLGSKYAYNGIVRTSAVNASLKNVSCTLRMQCQGNYFVLTMIQNSSTYTYNNNMYTGTLISGSTIMINPYRGSIGNSTSGVEFLSTIPCFQSDLQLKLVFTNSSSDMRMYRLSATNPTGTNGRMVVCVEELV